MVEEEKDGERGGEARWSKMRRRRRRVGRWKRRKRRIEEKKKMITHKQEAPQ